MIVDVSFIPEDLMPETLRSASARKLEYPYHNNRVLADGTSISFSGSNKSSHLVRNRIDYRKNYICFENELFEFAKEMYKRRKYDIAERSFKYMVEMGSKLAGSKEYLLKIYIKKKDVKGIKWVKKRIENQIKEPEAMPKENKKLEKVLKKYFPTEI